MKLFNKKCTYYISYVCRNGEIGGADVFLHGPILSPEDRLFVLKLVRKEIAPDVKELLAFSPYG